MLFAVQRVLLTRGGHGELFGQPVRHTAREKCADVQRDIGMTTVDLQPVRYRL